MRDLIRTVEEDKRGALVRFEGGESLWFGRDAWREQAGLAPGQEHDVDELRRWLLPRQYPAALNEAVRLLAQRARAAGEIASRLRARRYMEDTVDMVLYKLEKENLLDDAAFARDWAASRARQQVGRARILSELAHKGVARELAEAAVAALDEEERDGAATALAQKLLRRYRDEPDARKAMGKLMAAMARRGYGFDEARRAVEAAMAEAEDC